MEYEFLQLIFRLVLYFVIFLIFVAVVKFRMKRKLDYGKVAIAGFISGVLVSIILIIIGSSFTTGYQPNHIPAFIIGNSIGEGIIELIAFIMLYTIGKFLYKRMKKKPNKERQEI